MALLFTCQFFYFPPAETQLHVFYYFLCIFCTLLFIKSLLIPRVSVFSLAQGRGKKHSSYGIKSLLLFRPPALHCSNAAYQEKSHFCVPLAGGKGSGEEI